VAAGHRPAAHGLSQQPARRISSERTRRQRGLRSPRGQPPRRPTL